MSDSYFSILNRPSDASESDQALFDSVIEWSSGLSEKSVKTSFPDF